MRVKKAKVLTIERSNMFDQVTQGVLLLVGTLCFCGVFYHGVTTWYKERQWRRNNPDEHEIMNRKIKDDFSK